MGSGKRPNILTQPFTFGFIWSETGYKALQKVPKFRNQARDKEHIEKMPLGSPQFDTFLKLAQLVRYFASFSVTPEQKHTDREVVGFLCRRIFKICRSSQSHELYKKLPEDISENILPVFSELIINGQRAIMADLLHENVVVNTIQKAYEDRGIIPPKNRNIWIRDDKVRLVLSLIAKKMKMDVSAFFDYKPNKFRFGVKNNARMNYKEIKNFDATIRDKLDSSGMNVAESYNDTEDSEGAGLGLILARQSIEEVAKSADVGWDIRFEKPSPANTLMSIELLLDTPFTKSPKYVS